MKGLFRGVIKYGPCRCRPTPPRRSRWADFGALAIRLVAELERHGRVLHLDRARLEATLGRAGIADAAEGDATSLRLVQWIDECEAAHDWIVYQGDPAWTPWSERAARQADHVLVVARSGDGPALGPVGAQLLKRWRGVRATQLNLVLFWGPGEAPHESARWLDRRPLVRRHHHVRAGSDGDLARLAR
jgi:hypothetical protein